MDQDNNKAGKAFIEQVKATGNTDAAAAHTTVIIEGTAYGISEELAKEAGGTPDCADDTCVNLRSQINAVCKQNAWPAGHPVLVCTADGYCCNCHCL